MRWRVSLLRTLAAKKERKAQNRKAGGVDEVQQSSQASKGAVLEGAKAKGKTFKGGGAQGVVGDGGEGQ